MAKSRYIMVKQLGSNPSQIDGIDIGKGNTDKLIAGQTLHVVSMKFPHKLSACLPSNSKDQKDIIHDRKLLSSARNKTSVGVSDETNNVKSEGVLATKHPANSKSGPILKQDATSKTPHWSQGLKSSMVDPSMQVFKDDKVVVIKDKYPKARYHWLVMPIENIVSILHLQSSHLHLLTHMLEVGKEIVKKYCDERGKVKTRCRYGYHAVPSMSHLHMHVISQDFDSGSLKTKKHWNSFTTEYFVDAEDIISEIRADGKARNRRRMTELLKNPLRCHICLVGLKNMPELKKHILVCR